MNRYELEVFAGKRYGRSIGWMCNVINTGHSSPTSKIKGLIFLAFHDRVAPMAYCIDQIMIDGYVVSWSELEKYAGFYRENEEAMLLHISQLPEKTAYILGEAKLQFDAYHKNIQKAARILLNAGNYGEYTYVTSYFSGNSFWSAPEGEEPASIKVDISKGKVTKV